MKPEPIGVNRLAREWATGVRRHAPGTAPAPRERPRTDGGGVQPARPGIAPLTAFQGHVVVDRGRLDLSPVAAGSLAVAALALGAVIGAAVGGGD
jgi:hypothetical protein